MGKVILEMKAVTKTFPGVKALDKVNFTLKRGSVHAIIGENGAGKSTLMLTLGGVHKPDSGDIFLEGERIFFESSHDANLKGISVVYQDLSLTPELSIAENIFARRQPVRGFNLIDWDALYKNTRDILKRLGAQDLDPRAPVRELSIAKRQVVEILKAMSISPKILILDEPTSSLTGIEIQELFESIRKLKEEGISIIYISHHLVEIFEIADEVTVLRDGKHVCNSRIEDIDEEYLVSNMVGRKIDKIYGERDRKDSIGETLFEAKRIARKNDFSDINMHVNKGEIVGIAGLVGSGRTELGRAIFGAEPVESGDIYLNGKKVTFRNTQQAMKAGVGYLTEDRKQHGLYLDFDIKDNLVANHLNDFENRAGFLSRKSLETFAGRQVTAFNIITPGIDQIVNNLSGGNQQKVLVATWFGIKPKFLIVDEPTRGVDVGAKSDIYKLLRDLARQMVGIMVISSDLSEIIGMADRVYVMRAGKIVGELTGKDITEEQIIGLAASVQKMVKESVA